MEQGNEKMRERLLARLPQPANYAAYQQEVAAGIAKNEKRLKRTKWVTRGVWVYVILFFWFAVDYRGEKWLATPHGQVVEFGWLFLTICGAIGILKYFISQSRVELLTEVKQVQLQVLELQASLERAGFSRQ